MHNFDREVAQRAEQISKLPVWAKDLIFHLHRDLEAARRVAKEVTEGVDGNTTVVDPHDDFPRGIGINPLIEHEFSDLPGHRVQVTFGANRLEIYENGFNAGHLAIYPRSSNTAMIIPVRRTT